MSSSVDFRDSGVEISARRDRSETGALGEARCAVRRAAKRSAALVRDPYLAEDVASEIALRMIREPQDVRTPERFWMKAAYNLSVDASRRRTVRSNHAEHVGRHRARQDSQREPGELAERNEV